MIIAQTGKVTYLRAHDVGSGWGPNNDHLDVEPIMAFGFTLRADTNRVAHAAMFDLLRDAFANNWTVRIDYEIANEGLRNGRLLRAALVKKRRSAGPDSAPHGGPLAIQRQPAQDRLVRRLFRVVAPAADGPFGAVERGVCGETRLTRDGGPVAGRAVYVGLGSGASASRAAEDGAKHWHNDRERPDKHRAGRIGDAHRRRNAAVRGNTRDDARRPGAERRFRAGDAGPVLCRSGGCHRKQRTCRENSDHSLVHRPYPPAPTARISSPRQAPFPSLHRPCHPDRLGRRLSGSVAAYLEAIFSVCARHRRLPEARAPVHDLPFIPPRDRQDDFDATAPMP